VLPRRQSNRVADLIERSRATLSQPVSFRKASSRIRGFIDDATTEECALESNLSITAIPKRGSNSRVQVSMDDVTQRSVQTTEVASSLELFESATAVVDYSRVLADETQELLGQESSDSEDNLQFTGSPQPSREPHELSLSLIRLRKHTGVLDDRTSLSDSFTAIPAPVYHPWRPDPGYALDISISQFEKRPTSHHEVARLRPIVERTPSPLSVRSSSSRGSPVELIYHREDELDSESSGLNFNIVDSSDGEL
jgi:hypothetical protein